MTVGDLFDLLEEKLRTGELSRMDDVDVAGYAICSVDKVGATRVVIDIEEDFPDCSNCFEVDEESKRFSEQLDEIADLLDEAEEINMSNYDIDQVAALNNFYIEVSKILEDQPDVAA